VCIGEPDPIVLIIHSVTSAIEIAFSLLHTSSDINTGDQAHAFLLRYLAGANSISSRLSLCILIFHSCGSELYLSPLEGAPAGAEASPPRAPHGP
jgi:hypothetical protein